MAKNDDTSWVTWLLIAGLGYLLLRSSGEVAQTAATVNSSTQPAASPGTLLPSTLSASDVRFLGPPIKVDENDKTASTQAERSATMPPGGPDGVMTIDSGGGGGVRRPLPPYYEPGPPQPINELM
jgi:hypothetical protein